MTDMLGIILAFALLFVLIETDIPHKAAAATEAWLEASERDNGGDD